jgi:hypothetical protein
MIGILPTPVSATTTNSSFPIDLVVFVPCANGGAGESVELTGNLHDLFAVSTNANIGESSGINYTWHANERYAFDYNGNNAQSDFTITFSERLVSAGSSPNQTLTFQISVHVNADGTLTNFKFNPGAVTCKG